MKKLHLLPWLGLMVLLVVAFVPSLTDFNTSDFSTTGNKVRFNPGMTNYWTSLGGGTGIATNNGTGLGNTFTNATLWNGTNQGNAFTSPGSGVNSEQFGLSANASGTSATALGYLAAATNIDSTALGKSSIAGESATAVGSQAKATDQGATAIGLRSTARAPLSVAIGGLSVVAPTHTQSMAFGYTAATTTNNQIMLGTATETVVCPGILQAPFITGLSSNSFFGLFNANGVLFMEATNNAFWLTNAGAAIARLDRLSVSGNETNTSFGAGVVHSDANGKKSSSAVVESDLTLSANTTANVTTSQHGFAPVLPNDATKYLDGTGAYSVPAGGSTPWVRQILMWNSGGSVVLNNTTTYGALAGGSTWSGSGGFGSEAISATVGPVGGYLSNFTVFIAASTVPSLTTNIVFTVQTNAPQANSPTCVASPLVCTLFGGGSRFTNDTVHSATSLPNGGTFDVKVVTTNNVTTAAYSWTVEWWHQ